MATLYSNIYNSQSTPSALGNGTKESLGNLGGRVRQIYFEVTGVAVIAISDVLKCCVLPAGARVINWRLSIPSTGTTGIFKFGNAVSADAVEAADDDSFGLTYDSGGQAVLGIPVLGNAAILKKYASAVDLQLVATEATDVGAVTFKGMVEYVLD